MTAEQKTLLLRQILSGAGLVAPTASDAEVQQALVLARQQDPAGTSRALAAGGYPTFPWLIVLGVGVGGAVLYLAWKQYQKKSLGSVIYPDPDNSTRIRAMGRSLRPFRRFRGSTCRPALGRGRFAGKEEKYEFEPEIRLEGYRRRGRGARR